MNADNPSNEFTIRHSTCYTVGLTDSHLTLKKDIKNIIGEDGTYQTEEDY
jgi:hypothetical protein